MENMPPQKRNSGQRRKHRERYDVIYGLETASYLQSLLHVWVFWRKGAHETLLHTCNVLKAINHTLYVDYELMFVSSQVFFFFSILTFSKG